MSEALATAGRAYELEGTVNRLVDEISKSINSLNENWVKFSVALAEIRDNNYHKNLGFHSFQEYIRNLETRVQRKRTQIYGYLQAADSLLPYIGPKKLEEIGITNGLVLSRGMRISGNIPSEELIEYAADPENTTKDLEEKMNNEFKIHVPTGTSKWFDLGGFYAEPEEILEIKQAIKTAKKTDPVTNHKLSDSAQMKDVIFKWLREYEGTYAELVARGEA